jgi:hypothetical protein
MLVVSVESCLRTELSCSSKNCAANVLAPTGVPSSLNLLNWKILHLNRCQWIVLIHRQGLGCVGVVVLKYWCRCMMLVFLIFEGLYCILVVSPSG